MAAIFFDRCSDFIREGTDRFRAGNECFLAGPWRKDARRNFSEASGAITAEAVFGGWFGRRYHDEVGRGLA
jgi:hypothetical protein